NIIPQYHELGLTVEPSKPVWLLLNQFQTENKTNIMTIDKQEYIHCGIKPHEFNHKVMNCILMNSTTIFTVAIAEKYMNLKLYS
ncbi:hypothetical protein, partial [Bacillus cereus]|uniref:hypothetical protein n=1 Tax=Bacillus cereus TaxID=1396 RepID=UPI0034D3D9DC